MGIWQLLVPEKKIHRSHIAIDIARSLRNWSVANSRNWALRVHEIHNLRINSSSRLPKIILRFLPLNILGLSTHLGMCYMCYEIGFLFFVGGGGKKAADFRRGGGPNMSKFRGSE